MKRRTEWPSRVRVGARVGVLVGVLPSPVPQSASKAKVMHCVDEEFMSVSSVSFIMCPGFRFFFCCVRRKLRRVKCVN